MSFSWMMRVQGRVPLTLQEERVKRILGGMGLRYECHKVFRVADSNLVVDFVVEAGDRRIIIECSHSAARQGKALSLMKRTCAYLDVRFVQLKALHPNFICIAFIEAPQVYSVSLKDYLKPFLTHANAFAISEEELASELNRLM